MKTFTAKLKTEEVKIDDKSYYVQEMSGATRESWVEQMDKRSTLKVSKDEKGEEKREREFHDTKGMVVQLVALCLLDSEKKPVTAEEIGKFPPATIEGLYDIADELNGLTKKTADAKEKAAKNDSGASDSIGTGSP